MKYILLLLIAAGFAAYYLPAQEEAAASACAALEKRVRNMAEVEIARMPNSSDPRAQAAIAQAKAQLPTAAMIERLVRERLPMLPPEAGCAVGYWVVVFKPDLLLTLLPGPPPRPAG